MSINLLTDCSAFIPTFLIIDFEAKMQEYLKEMAYSSLIRREKEDLTFYQFPLFQLRTRSGARRIHPPGRGERGYLRRFKSKFFGRGSARAG